MSNQAEGTVGKRAVLFAAFLVTVTSAAFGVALTPANASATSAERTHWKCTGMYECGPGTRECCNEGNGGTLMCSTQCDIIIT
jgi:hypothetical protein